LVVLTLIPIYSFALIVGVANRSAAWQIIVFWNRHFLKLFGVEVNVEYVNPDIDMSSGGVVVGLNQQSLLDPIIGQVAAPKMFMSIWNIEYAIIPFIGWISLLFGWVIIRQWPRQAKTALKKAVSYIRKGGFVYLSIEGSRSKDGSLGEYKKGPVVLAIQAKTNIYPVIIKGSRKCLPYGQWKIRPGTVTVKGLNEFSVVDMSYEDRNQIVRQLREIAHKELFIETL
jgi:1-acyl-sn-glycerol-3-phosphate acyltransferase